MVCKYPHLASGTAYNKGCRCEECKEHMRKNSKIYYQKNKEMINNKATIHYQNNKEKIDVYNREWCRKNKDKVELYNLTSKLKKFGMSTKEYKILMKKQDGKCAICSVNFSNENKANKLSIDHCHDTERVRGLLCNNCNTGLGMFNDSITKLKFAIVYLEGD